MICRPDENMRYPTLVMLTVSISQAKVWAFQFRFWPFAPSTATFLRLTLVSNKFLAEMFVRIMTVHCGQNNSYDITINGFQVRKINKIRKRNFRSPLWETFLSVKAEVGMFTKLSTWWYPNILGKNLNNIFKKAWHIKWGMAKSNYKRSLLYWYEEHYGFEYTYTYHGLSQSGHYSWVVFTLLLPYFFASYFLLLLKK